jgi:hypothetical protein
VPPKKLKQKLVKSMLLITFFYAGFVRFRMGNEPGEAPTVANTVEIMQQQQNVSFDEFLSAFIFNEFSSYKFF